MTAGESTRGRTLIDWFALAWLTALLGGLVVLVGALIWYIAVVNSRGADRLMLTVSVLPVISVVGLVATTVVRRGVLALFMAVAMGLAAASGIGWMILIWTSFNVGVDSPIVVKGLGTATLVAIALASMGYLLTSPDQRRPLPTTRAVLFWSGTAMVGGVLLLMWSYVLQRIWGYVLALTLLSGLAFVLSGLVHIVAVRVLARRAKRIESMPRTMSVAIECPRCGFDQTMTTGLSRCRECGLALTIEVEEPRCECGYLLYQLEGNSCPECGREVAGGGGFAALGS